MNPNQITLSEEEQRLLAEILRNPSSEGPFVGMCTNIWFGKCEDSIEYIIQKALQHRLAARKMIEATQ